MRLTGRAISIPSVVIDNLNLSGSKFSPDKADAPLVIDSDTVLALPIFLQSL
jgi:hypothetical protein